MIRFLAWRVLRMAAILFGVLLITFLLMHAIPGSPWNNYSGAPRVFANLAADASTLREVNRRFGLDLPMWRQFTRYVVGDFDEEGHFFCGVVCGNLGPSIMQRGREVEDIVFEPPRGGSLWESRFGYSIRLVLLSAIIAVGLGVPLGITSAARPKSKTSRAISVALAAMISVPNFVLGLLAILLLASWLRITQVLPDWDTPGDWIVPAVVLAVMPMASLARVTQASFMNILGEDYVRAARAKGLTQRRVMLVHVARNALVPIITYLGPALIEMFAGLFVVESLYAFPGLGREYWQSVLKLDYPVILGITLIYATGMLLINMLGEGICAALDPRLRLIQRPEAP